MVLAGGDIVVTHELKRTVQEADFIVAADSGLRHAASLGVMPELVIGDFDSVERGVLALYPDLPRQEHSPEKDALDLELALDYVLERGANRLLIVGGLGGRLDQTLTALHIAAKLHSEGMGVHLDSGDESVFFVKGGERLELSLPIGRRFSVLSLAPTSVVTIEGARYELVAYSLPFGVGLGVSNRVERAPLGLELSQGLVIVTVG